MLIGINVTESITFLYLCFIYPQGPCQINPLRSPYKPLHTAIAAITTTTTTTATTTAIVITQESQGQRQDQGRGQSQGIGSDR